MDFEEGAPGACQRDGLDFRLTITVMASTGAVQRPGVQRLLSAGRRLVGEFGVEHGRFKFFIDDLVPSTKRKAPSLLPRRRTTAAHALG
jgi:hypothetical protein